ncbi:mechanosensitive ion channel [candidate division KSB1 bacterium]|nr:mechanosensitive ion channel [candidate division KSB1 bacterium]
MEQYLQVAIELAVKYVPKLLLAIVSLFIGLWIIKIFTKALRKSMVRGKIDISLHHFLTSMVNILLKVLVFVSVASMIGIQMTSFVAILGAAGLAVGLALQGGLANFAGGVIILINKPYKVGDYISTQGYSGTVKAIQVFHTVLTTPDNKTIIIPNGELSNSSMTNYSTEPTRRVDMTFGIGYSDDIQKAKEILKRLVEDESRVLKEPAYQIVLAELGESSVNFAVRVWSKKEDYWGIFFDMQEKVKQEFDKNNISIPFPQRDIHVYNH